MAELLTIVRKEKAKYQIKFEVLEWLVCIDGYETLEIHGYQTGVGIHLIKPVFVMEVIIVPLSLQEPVNSLCYTPTSGSICDAY